MNLAQWCSATGVALHPTNPPGPGRMIYMRDVAYQACIQKNRPLFYKLWRLSDFKVENVVYGYVHIVPRPVPLHDPDAVEEVPDIDDLIGDDLGPADPADDDARDAASN